MTLRTRASSLLLRPAPPPRTAGVAVALGAVAAITVAIFA